MKAYDYEAVVVDCEIYCTECAPDDADEGDVSPIFADSEWDYVPVCCVCGAEHDYMTIVHTDDEEMTDD